MRAAAVIILLGLLMCWGSAHAADAPSQADVDKLSQEATAIYAEFMEVSAPERLQFELAGRGLEAGASARLAKLSSVVVARFSGLVTQGDALRVKVEDYQGQDWESRYGSTGLWRRLKAEIYRVMMFRYEARYWSAMAAAADDRLGLLREIAAEIAAFRADFHSDELSLLYARVLCAGPEDGPQWQSGMAIVDELCAGDETDTVHLAARLERYRLKATHDAEELAGIWRLVKASAKTDDELLIRTGFAGWTAGNQDWLEEVVRRCPQSRQLLDRCVLATAEERMAKDGVQWIGAYAANLAADSAAKEPEAHKAIIAAMANVREYRGPEVLYAAGLLLEKTEPLKAAAVFVEVSRKMDGETAVRTAARAATLAYDQFRKDKGCCSDALPIVEYYAKLTARPAPEMAYCHYLLTAQCGDANQARRLLESLAGGPSGRYQMIANHTLSVMRATEALKAGRLPQAAEFLAAGLDTADASDEPLAADIVEKFLDRWEDYEETDGRAGLQNCTTLMTYCRDWAKGEERTRIRSLADETSILFDGDTTHTSATGGTVRCMARYMMAVGNWQQAGEKWGLVCEWELQQSKGDVRTWQWWRAKYYQLLCWSKGKDATKEELARRVDVTLSSCGPVPELWKKKLTTLSSRP
jgi:hypothetical protein